MLVIGMELELFNSRITINADYYKNRSSNQLVGYPLPPTTGFNTIQSNFPATVENTGLELSVSSMNIQSKPFTWSTVFNISIPKNKLIAFPDLELSPAYADKLVVGQPLDILKLYHYTGVDPDTGVHTVLDVNDDGVINDDDKQTIKRLGREYYGGLMNSLNYKGFQLNILFQFVKQTGTKLSLGTPGFMTNQPVSVLDRWQSPGDVTDTQLFVRNSSRTYGYYTSSDAFITDASFIRLKNVSISYTLPKVLLERIHLADAKIFINGQNLLSLTKYEGLDPEFPSISYLPSLRVISAGFNVTF